MYMQKNVTKGTLKKNHNKQTKNQTTIKHCDLTVDLELCHPFSKAHQANLTSTNVINVHENK